MKILMLILFGALGGVLGGMGMGGGTLLIPLLTFFCSVELKTAQACNLLAFIPMAVIAIILHKKNGLIDMKGTLKTILFAVALSIVGALCSKYVQSKILTRIFGGFLIALSIVQFFSENIAQKIQQKSKKNIDKNPPEKS